MKKILKYASALTLVAAMLVSCAGAAFAATPARDFDRSNYAVQPADKAAYVDFFNESVNSLKSDTPYVNVKYTAGVPENGIVKSADGESEALAPEAEKYIGALLDGFFSEKNSAFRSLIKAVLGSESVKNDSFELHRGAKRNSLIPLYGEEYVSALKSADDYDILINQKAGSEYPTELAITNFGDVELSDVGKSSLPLLYSLPDGGMDMTLIGKGGTSSNFLSGIKLTDFKFKDAKVVTKYDRNGVLKYYGSVITYNFAFNYFDAVKLMSAFLGVDIYTATMDMINSILGHLNREDINAESILLNRKLTITYTVLVEISNIDYSPRYYGDINDNGEVDAADARLALRHSVSLGLITATEDLLYGDVNFDGEITAADARLILRMSVGLDDPFLEVPEGKEVKIIVVEQDHTGEEADDGEETEVPEEFKGLIDFDPAVTPTDLIDWIFATITNVENAEGFAKGDIQSMVDIIRGIVSDSREKNT